jgi:hypothetical protein
MVAGALPQTPGFIALVLQKMQKKKRIENGQHKVPKFFCIFL